MCKRCTSLDGRRSDQQDDRRGWLPDPSSRVGALFYPSLVTGMFWMVGFTIQHVHLSVHFS
jgi:hypothetical protein